MIDLTLLVASMHQRGPSLVHLLECIARQRGDLLLRTQVLIDIDDDTILGAKRQRMLENAAGRYVAFVDDDDEITDDYLEHVFAGIDKGVDHVGVGMLFFDLEEEAEPVEVVCSLHNDWCFDGKRYLRGPQHVCAVKKELALQAGFPTDMGWGQDKPYSDALRPLVKTEHLTPPVYRYLFRRHK